RHGDASGPDRELDHRPARAPRLLHVELDVLDHARGPRVVEVGDLVVARHAAMLPVSWRPCDRSRLCGPRSSRGRARPPPGPPVKTRGVERSARDPRGAHDVNEIDWQAHEAEAVAAIGTAASTDDVEEARVRYLGRKSAVALALREVRDRESGMLLNGIRQ